MTTNQLPELPDEQILAEAERAIAGAAAQGEPGPLQELCALLAHMPERASPQFQQSLEQQLVARLAAPRAGAQGAVRRRSASAQAQGVVGQDASRSGRGRPALRALLAGLIVLLLGFFFPGVRSAAGEILQRLLAGGYVEEPGGPLMFVPAPPFVVKQPTYLPRGMRRVGDRYITGPSSSATQAPATAGPTATPIMPGPLWEAFGQPRGTAPSITLAYEDADGSWLVLFERARQMGELLPVGEHVIVNANPAVLQRGERGLRLTWVSDETWIELEGSLPREAQLRVAEGIRTSQHSTQRERAQPGTDTESVFVEIPLLSAEQAQERALFRIPEPRWIPPGFSQVGSSAMGAWARHLYRVPAVEGAEAPSINLEILWGRDEGTYEYSDQTGEETVQVNGAPAHLMLGETTQHYVFSWEADGFSYRLSFNRTGLSRADMLRMAESVHPIEE